jgi:hypothetical protein
LQLVRVGGGDAFEHLVDDGKRVVEELPHG